MLTIIGSDFIVILPPSSNASGVLLGLGQCARAEGSGTIAITGIGIGIGIGRRRRVSGGGGVLEEGGRITAAAVRTPQVPVVGLP